MPSEDLLIQNDFEKADVEVQYYFNKGRITHVPDHIYFDAKKIENIVELRGGGSG